VAAVIGSASAKYRKAANSGSTQFSQEAYAGSITSSISLPAAQDRTCGRLCGEKLSQIRYSFWPGQRARSTLRKDKNSRQRLRPRIR
jgi:hypothetical protein